MLFKRKYKRSNWMKGLLDCEREYKNGMRMVPSDTGVTHLWLSSEDGNYKLGLDTSKHFELATGYIAYIHYYENNLKNIENNQ